MTNCKRCGESFGWAQIYDEAPPDNCPDCQSTLDYRASELKAIDGDLGPYWPTIKIQRDGFGSTKYMSISEEELKEIEKILLKKGRG